MGVRSDYQVVVSIAVDVRRGDGLGVVLVGLGALDRPSRCDLAFRAERDTGPQQRRRQHKDNRVSVAPETLGWRLSQYTWSGTAISQPTLQDQPGKAEGRAQKFLDFASLNSVAHFRNPAS